MAVLYRPPSKNGVQKTLAAQLLNTAGVGDPITFDDVDGLNDSPGVLVINRIDSNGTATPSSREYISYSSISGNTVLIETRNVDGSGAARTHSVGAIVEFIPDIVWAESIYDTLSNAFDPATQALDTTKVVTPSGTQSLFNKMISGATLSGGVITNPTIIGPTITATLTGRPSIDRPVMLGSVTSIRAASDAASVTFDLLRSNFHTVTLGGNRTLLVSNATLGQPFITRIGQDSTGSRTVTWFASINWAGGNAPTLTTTGNKSDQFGFISVASGAFDGFVIGQNI